MLWHAVIKMHKQKNHEKAARKKREIFTVRNAVYLIFAIMVISILDAAHISSKASLEKDAKMVLSKISDESTAISFLDSNNVVEEKIENLDKMNYEDIKDIVGIESDFCIYLEDVTGNLIAVGNDKSGIGSNKIHINNKPCE